MVNITFFQRWLLVVKIHLSTGIVTVTKVTFLVDWNGHGELHWMRLNAIPSTFKWHWSGILSATRFFIVFSNNPLTLTHEFHGNSLGDSTGLLMGTHGVPEGHGSMVSQAASSHENEGTKNTLDWIPLKKHKWWELLYITTSRIAVARKIRKLHESLVLGEGISQNAEDKWYPWMNLFSYL